MKNEITIFFHHNNQCLNLLIHFSKTKNLLQHHVHIFLLNRNYPTQNAKAAADNTFVSYPPFVFEKILIFFSF